MFEVRAAHPPAAGEGSIVSVDVSFSKRYWEGGKWASSMLVSHEMLTGEPHLIEDELERLVHTAHSQMATSALTAGVPLKARRCEHTVHQEEDVATYGVTLIGVCAVKAVEWAVLDREDTRRVTIEHYPEPPIPCGWSVKGHRGLGLFISEGHALAAAWSVTEAGGQRPDVIFG